MKREFLLPLLGVFVSVVGCVNEPTSQSGESTTFENAVVGDQAGQVVMTESGDGTRGRPLGVDFDVGDGQPENPRY
jgi:hypothetical protein